MEAKRVETLQQMEATKPADPFIKFALALEFLNSGQNENAELYFAKLLADFPNYSPTYYHYGKMKEETGEIETAISLYKKGITIAAANGETKNLNELKEALLLIEE
jgi:tetratricopeptide (TPR) repeat protein